jgi:uncharacterized protein
LTGRLELRLMQRLRELISNREGYAAYNLDFRRDDKGIINITGVLSATLVVMCQRCLNEMDLHLSTPVHIGLVGSQEEMKNLPDFLEPFLMEGREISLLKLIEEELLLGLPLSPLHDAADCPASHEAEKYTPDKKSPFAILKDMKTDK